MICRISYITKLKQWIDLLRSWFMLWINIPTGDIGREIGIRIGQEIGIEMLAIETLIEIHIEIKVDHPVGIGIQGLLVDPLDIGIIEGTETEIETGIEIEIIGEIEVHQMMVMKVQDPEAAQELDIILI